MVHPSAPGLPPASPAAPHSAGAIGPLDPNGNPFGNGGGALGGAFGEALDAVAEGVGTMPEEQLQPAEELDTGLALYAVIFAGGIGSRFWPLASPERPKQLLALVGERPLIADTVARLAPAIPPDRVLVLTSADISAALHAAIPEVPERNMLIEPRPMGTAAALAWGAHEVGKRAGPNALVVAMHADLAVGYPQELRRTLGRAAQLASDGAPLVALGAEPTRPETGFGYLMPGEALDLEEGAQEVSNAGRQRRAARRVTRFVEKPGPLLAEQLVDQDAFWHTGIVVGTSRAVLEALEKHTPELETGLAALQAGKLDRFAGLIQSVSIERGLLERVPELVVLPADCGWDDVGTWAALRRVRELDDTGNGVWGPAHVVDAASCVVHSEGHQTVVLYGVSGMLVVTRPGLTFVTSLDRATELNSLLDALPEQLSGRQRRELL